MRVERISWASSFDAGSGRAIIKASPSDQTGSPGNTRSTRLRGSSPSRKMSLGSTRARSTVSPFFSMEKESARWSTDRDSLTNSPDTMDTEGCSTRVQDSECSTSSAAAETRQRTSRASSRSPSSAPSEADNNRKRGDLPVPFLPSTTLMPGRNSRVVGATFRNLLIVSVVSLFMVLATAPHAPWGVQEGGAWGAGGPGVISISHVSLVLLRARSLDPPGPGAPGLPQAPLGAPSPRPRRPRHPRRAHHRRGAERARRRVRPPAREGDEPARRRRQPRGVRRALEDVRAHAHPAHPQARHRPGPEPAQPLHPELVRGPVRRGGLEVARPHPQGDVGGLSPLVPPLPRHPRAPRHPRGGVHLAARGALLPPPRAALQGRGARGDAARAQGGARHGHRRLGPLGSAVRGDAPATRAVGAHP